MGRGAVTDLDHSVTTDHCPDGNDVRAAYPVAVELRLEASRGVFERLNIMLLTNSIILLGVVSALTAPRPLHLAGLLLCAFGILASGVWLVRIRDARKRVSEYGAVIASLERCLPGITTFTRTQAAHRKRREWWLSRRLETSKIEQIGAAEWTIIPLVLLYLYLASVAATDGHLLPALMKWLARR